MIVIYKIANPAGKIYIGQSRHFGKRLRAYKSGRIKSQRKLFYSIQKYGFENHIVNVVHELPYDVSQQTIDTYEQIYMDQYKACGVDLLNIKEAGSRGKASEETKLLMSKANKGKCFRKNWKPSGDHILKVKNALTGRLASKEKRDNISKALTGRRLSSEHKAKAVKNLSNKKGKIFSGEHRKALSDALTGRKRSQESINASKAALKGRPAWNKGMKGKYKVNKSESKIEWL
jgi:group I intron endonuclease